MQKIQLNNLMILLERENSLNELNRAFSNLLIGNGSVVMVSGEAGIGKTSLVEMFTRQLENKANVLWGTCDALFTPRPLGPLYDIASQLNTGLLNLLDDRVVRTKIFTKFHKDLQESRDMNVLIIEDIHWADESTIDLIKFLGRRVNKSRFLLVTTFRDDEIGIDHPVKLLFGDLLQKNVIRIKLLPLSESSVNILAGKYGKSVPDLYKKSSGNPFFINEILENSDARIPISIRDAVLSKLSRLNKETRNFIELASVVPGKIKKEFAKRLTNFDEDIIEYAVDSGFIKIDSTGILFRHELVRLAVEETLSALKKERFNSLILSFLLQENAEKNLPAIVHHAISANDKTMVLKYTPLAAAQAEILLAHREAALHYSRLLKYSDHLSLTDLVKYIEKYAYQCYLTNQHEEALKARKQALQIWEKMNDLLQVGNTYRWLSRISWFLGNKSEADTYANEAIKFLQKFPGSDELAMAFSNRSQLYMLSDNQKDAVRWGEKAINISEKNKNFEILSHALNNVGTSLIINSYNPEGERKLLRSLEIALKNELEEHAARAYTNLGCRATETRYYKKAEKYFLDGINYCNEHDLDSWALYMQAWLARVYLETGRWNESGDTAQKVLGINRISVVSKIPALTTLGWLRLRRGDPEAITVLKEVKELAVRADELQRIGPVAIALLEAAWLYENNKEFLEFGQTAHRMAAEHKNYRVLGQTSFWLWKSGLLKRADRNIFKPYLNQINGNWKSAADYWKKYNNPYEEALALSDGNNAAMFRALEIFKKLGANPAIEKLQLKMRKKRIKRVPRGPNSTTSKNPMGLTNRQFEVLNLLATGLSNNTIAEKLFISPKTVDHHISAIFSKLNIHSRTEAAALVHSGTSLKK